MGSVLNTYFTRIEAEKMAEEASSCMIHERLVCFLLPNTDITLQGNTLGRRVESGRRWD